MRITLLAVVLFFGGLIGINAIQTVSQMQESKMSRFCKSIPIGASYDEVCARYRTAH